MTFQAFDYKERNFFDLNNNNGIYICPTYTKEEAWLKHFGLSNLLYIWITRLITNYASIGEYRLRFFSKKSIACLYRNYFIKMRRYIIFECPRYNKY